MLVALGAVASESSVAVSSLLRQDRHFTRSMLCAYNWECRQCKNHFNNLLLIWQLLYQFTVH